MINPHWLIGNSDKKEVRSIEVIFKLFGIWKKLMKKNNLEINEFEAFTAGFFLGTNNILREKYLNECKEEKYDLRIQNET